MSVVKTVTVGGAERRREGKGVLALDWWVGVGWEGGVVGCGMRMKRAGVRN